MRGAELVLYVGLGQSLLALVPRGAPLPVQEAPLDPARAFVFGQGGSPRLCPNPLEPLDPALLGDLGPHVRHRVSGPLTEATAALLAVLGPSDAVLTVNLARRGAKLTDFGRVASTAAHANLCLVLERAQAQAQARGMRLGRMVVSWVQGQADRHGGKGTYLAGFTALVGDIAAAHAAVTGMTGGVLVCLSQNTATSPGTRRCVAAEQFQAVAGQLAAGQAATGQPATGQPATGQPATGQPATGQAGAQLILSGPEYMLERSDGLHLTPLSAAYLGAQHGRAIAQALTVGAWQPLHMARALRQGAQVLVDFAGGQGDLVADCTGLPLAGAAQGGVRIGVRNLPALGFRWAQRGGTPVTLLGAQVSGPRQVCVQLSDDPGAGSVAVLHLGLPAVRDLPEGFVAGDPATAKGGATNLRGTHPAAHVCGLPLYDWAVQQSVVVGTAAFPANDAAAE